MTTKDIDLSQTTIILEHTYKDPVKVVMVTTSGYNREVGKRAEIRNMMSNLIGKGVGEGLQKKDIVLGLIQSKIDCSQLIEVYFVVQRKKPGTITAITLQDQDLEAFLSPELGVPVLWVWNYIKILRII